MNLTVVMITHQMEVVRDACDQVAVIENGTVVEQGLVTEIFKNPKTATTKDFLSHIEKDDDEKEFARWSNEGGKYSLHFVDEGTGSPIISQVCKKFDVDINIRAGGIQHLPENDIGTMIVDITGSDNEVEKAIAFFKENGVSVENEV